MDSEPQLPATAADVTLASLASEPAGLQLVICGHCMEPVIRDGDTVMVRPGRCYLPGDILVFRNVHGNLAAHRLLGYRLRRGRLEMVTAGDRSGGNDVPVAADRIIGRVTTTTGPVRVTAMERARAVARFMALVRRRILR